MFLEHSSIASRNSRLEVVGADSNHRESPKSPARDLSIGPLVWGSPRLSVDAAEDEFMSKNLSSKAL